MEVGYRSYLQLELGLGLGLEADYRFIPARQVAKPAVAHQGPRVPRPDLPIRFRVRVRVRVRVDGF